MILNKCDANIFMRDYSLLMSFIYGPPPYKPGYSLLDIVAAGQKKFCANRSLLDTVLADLAMKSITVVEPEVALAIRSLQLQRWIYLKDTKTHSVFINPDGKTAYGVFGLTQPIKSMVGDSRAFIETGVLKYRGHFICDGVITGTIAFLGKNYTAEFTSLFSELRSQGKFLTTC